ncbi:MAG: reverse transcriptase domain-containing protein, partial [Candidatus Thiodiazotropha endolucinida]|nr:hypothetical protein [Candidatus Thiodiazotropha taylori]MCW4343435.1 reverse transcriptase domain-containing protein [Candidatus Thiodiazotropha endolucinida]
MAKFSPPETFDFSHPTQWTDWKERFSRFRLASKLNKEEGEVQVSSLIYTMGKEAENVFKSFELDAEDSKNYATVLEKFDLHFIPKRNYIHERAKFHQRQQNSGETVESFIRSLYELAENCDFGNKKNEQIRDRIVIGILDKELSEKLQLKSDLDLETAVSMSRQAELVKGQVRDQSDKHLEEIKGARPKYFHHKHQQQQQQKQSKLQYKQRNPNPQIPQCSRCNRRHGDKAKCPAMGQKCRRCDKMNHFQVCCKSKRPAVREVIYDDNYDTDDSDPGVYDASARLSEYFIGSIDCISDEKPWIATLNICSTDIDFKIDTGADTTVISEKTFTTLKRRPALKRATSVLTSPGGQLECKGYFIAETFRNGKLYKFRIFVVAGQNQNNLLGRNAASSLNLVRRIEEINDGVFGSIGLLNCEPVAIELKPDAKPYSITTPRRVPFPLMPKVEKELNRMLADDIIERVTEPTDWCAPMVVVPKPSGKVRICVDLQKLNQAVKRERLMLPTLDDIAPKLVGMKVFSKLDASSGFYQLPLRGQSSKLTTFITPFGRFAFKRVPFGISSASEIYQAKMLELLKGLEGVDVIIDDILIYGRNRKEHDHRLRQVIDRIERAGLKLNREKCEFRKSRLEYFGHIISDAGLSPNPVKVQSVRNLKAPENVTELQRVLGMINYLGRYIPDLSTIIKPMTDLLKSKTAWFWGPDQESAFMKVKDMLTCAPVLAFYDKM